MLSLSFDFTFEAINAITDAASISFEFSFARTSPADSAGQTRECRILTGDQSRQQVFQLRQFDLDLAFFRLRALREDVENQLRTVDDLQIRCFGQRADLRRREFA